MTQRELPEQSEEIDEEETAIDRFLDRNLYVFAALAATPIIFLFAAVLFQN